MSSFLINFYRCMGMVRDSLNLFLNVNRGDTYQIHDFKKNQFYQSES